MLLRFLPVSRSPEKIQALQVSEQFLASIHRHVVVSAHIGAVAVVVTAWLEEVSRQDRQDEDVAVAACRNHSVQLSQGGSEEGVGGHHQVANHVVLLIFLQAGERDEVAVLVHSLETRVVEAVQDDWDRLRQLAQILRQYGEECIYGRLADCPAAGVHALHCLANVGEGVMKSTGVAASNDHSIRARDYLAGSLRHNTAELSQSEGIGIQIPLENTAELREEGIDQNLLISSTHPRERVAESCDQMAHEHKISKQLI